MPKPEAALRSSGKLDTRLALIQVLIPIGLAAVAEALQEADFRLTSSQNRILLGMACGTE